MFRSIVPSLVVVCWICASGVEANATHNRDRRLIKQTGKQVRLITNALQANGTFLEAVKFLHDLRPGWYVEIELAGLRDKHTPSRLVTSNFGGGVRLGHSEKKGIRAPIDARDLAFHRDPPITLANAEEALVRQIATLFGVPAVRRDGRVRSLKGMLETAKRLEAEVRKELKYAGGIHEAVSPGVYDRLDSRIDVARSGDHALALIKDTGQIRKNPLRLVYLDPEEPDYERVTLDSARLSGLRTGDVDRAIQRNLKEKATR